MIERPLILGCTLTSCTSLSGRAWAVTATIDDPLEINDGWGIARGDIVFLDFRAVTTPPSVGRYVISSITTKASRSIGMVLDWASAMPPQSPSACLNVRGYLAQPVDAAGTVQHPTQQTILIQQEMIDLAKQADIFAIGDEASEAEQVRSFPVGEMLEPGQFAHILPSGVAVKALPQDMSRMPAAGLVLAVQGGLARVQVSGIVPGVANGLVAGAPVFVGDGGLPITDPAGITLPAAIQITGVALDSSTVSLAINGQVVKRA